MALKEENGTLIPYFAVDCRQHVVVGRLVIYNQTTCEDAGG